MCIDCNSVTNNDKEDAAKSYLELQSIHGQVTEEEVKAENLKFETSCRELKHKMCNTCRCVSLHIDLVCYKGQEMCVDCKRNKSFDCDQSTMLPLWTDEYGNLQYQLPQVLKVLREAEKLLIAQMLVYVPLHHMKKRQIGCKGHVCCFCQEIGKLCMTLPRVPDDVRLIRVVKKFRLEDNSVGTKAFSVRRQVVLDALRWLKKYNVLYKDIVIEENNLSWIEDGVEQQFPATEVDDIDISSEQETDKGPSTSQVNDVLAEEIYHESVTGCVDASDGGGYSEKNNHIIDEIKNATRSGSKTTTMEWPYVSKEAVSEYESTSNLFPKAFPWLFPGGIGDYKSYKDEKLDVGKWAKRLLYYQDGRFAKDKMWGSLP